MSQSFPEILCRETQAAEIQPLRGKVLRPHTGMLIFPHDNDAPPLAWHCGAFTHSAPTTCIACLSLFSSPYQNRSAFQLRGMAVQQDFRRQHVGAHLLQFAEDIITAAGTHLVWCNARIAAIPFYSRLGWHTRSAPFILPDAGLHKIMVKEL